MYSTEQAYSDLDEPKAICAPEQVCGYCTGTGVIVRFLSTEFKESCSHCTIFDQQWLGYYNEMRRRFLLELLKGNKLQPSQVLELQLLQSLE